MAILEEITESLDVDSSLLICGYILKGYMPHSHVKVTGSKSRSQHQKSAKFPIHTM